MTNNIRLVGGPKHGETYDNVPAAHSVRYPGSEFHAGLYVLDQTQDVTSDRVEYVYRERRSWGGRDQERVDLPGSYRKGYNDGWRDGYNNASRRQDS